MIPYISFTSFNIGPIAIQVWGLFVALGILSALIVSFKLAKKRELEFRRIPDLGFWVILAALIGGRIVYVLGKLDHYLEYPIDILKVWEGGMSISGGFIFAIVAGYFYCKQGRLNFWDYAEVYIFGLPLGLFIGRLGCFFIFDHPGVETSFFLGERYADGLIRHNHGLYLSLNGLLLFIAFLILNKTVKPKFRMFYMSIFLIEYGIMRFSIDFLRIGDPTFFYLTIAQYLSIFMVVIAIILIVKHKKA